VRHSTLTRLPALLPAPHVKALLTNPLTPLRSLRAALALLLTVPLAACQFQQHREELGQLQAAGELDRALNILNDPRTQELYGPQDRLLLDLDRAALLFYRGQDDQAFAAFERAEAVIDSAANTTNAGDTALQWLLNDTYAKYVGEPYEDLYVNVFKLMGHLRQGRIDGAATVEARRLASKSTLLRDRFLAQSTQARDAWASRKGSPQQLDDAGTRTDLFDPTTGGTFIESPLGTYLSAVTFMKAGEPDLQGVAARRLQDAIGSQQALIGPARAEAFAGLASVQDRDANVLLVALAGRGPIKRAQRIGPIPLGDIPVYFELPLLRTFPAQTASVRVTLTPTGAGAAQTVELNFIEDLGRVASENHRRQLPLIYTRTLIRAALKSAASFVVTEAVRKGQGGPRRDADGEAILSVLAGLAVIAATERADLRCWTFLPGQAFVGLASAPPGTYDVTTAYLGAQGQTLDETTQRGVQISDAPGALATMISRSSK
jgi:hypothetical protein